MQAVSQRVTPYLTIGALALVFFAPLVAHPTGVLYSDQSDLLAMHLPLKRFLVRSWQETGELPLWCPYSFGGMPLAHDVQVAAFYPLHLPLYLLPEPWIGAALSWLVVIHVLIAGCCMIAYARHQGLEGPALLVAGAGYMFAGKWLLHVLAGGHYIMTPLAWLPMVLLLLERAVERRSLRLATWAGLVFALIVTGTHPQMTLYAGIFIGLWTFGCWSNRVAGPESSKGVAAASTPFEDSGSATLPAKRKNGVPIWLGLGSWTALVATAASAIQVLPAIEATTQASRAAGVPARDILRAGLLAILGAVGPAWREGWEDRAGLGVLWLGVALLAPLLCAGRTRRQAAAALALALFAFGGGALFQSLPGLRLFQIPVRMLLLLALPVALLAGRTTQILLESIGQSPQVRGFCRGVLLRVAAGGTLLSGVAAWCSYRAWRSEAATAEGAVNMVGTFAAWMQQLPPSLVLYWPVALCATAMAWWLLGPGCRLSRGAWGQLWVTLLVVDLWALTWPQVAVRQDADIYAPSPSIELLAGKKGESPDCHWRVLDRGLPGEPSSSPLGSALCLLGGVELEPVLGYNSFDVRPYKEYLQWIMDEDQDIRPRSGIFGYPIIGTFPIENKKLLDLLGVRFLIQPASLAQGTLQARGEGRGEPLADTSWHRIATDPKPQVYSFLGAGVRRLPPFDLYENSTYFPRALLVPRACLLRDRAHALEQMKRTNFSRVVLIEEGTPDQAAGTDEIDTGSFPGLPPFPPGEHTARIRHYLPNRVVVETTSDVPAFLVLNDVWYPGWTCTIDGVPATLHRANFLFRAVAVSSGTHQVDFVFAPRSYAWGKAISLGTLLAIALATLARRRPPARSAGFLG
jgi:hypothetical protein